MKQDNLFHIKKVSMTSSDGEVFLFLPPDKAKNMDV